MPAVRPAAVAGAFYPRGREELAATLAELLRAARTEIQEVPVPPKALIAPHAGYIYSGGVAASGYARLAPIAERIKRVVLLGPAHRVAVRGLALPGAGAFETPLGSVPIDAQAAARIADLPQVVTSSEAHALEHSIEVHLPFLQAVLKDFSVLPLVVGRATAEEVAEVLDRLWGDDDTLLVVSSDLSHYHDYDTARRLDGETLDGILRLAPETLDGGRACGYRAVRGLLLWARGQGMSARLVDLRNSGDTAGDRSRVVGYAAVAFD